MGTGQLRKRIYEACPTDSDLEAFLFDYFPDVYRRLSGSMDQVEKVTWLLRLEQSDRIGRALEEFDKSKAEPPSPEKKPPTAKKRTGSGARPAAARNLNQDLNQEQSSPPLPPPDRTVTVTEPELKLFEWIVKNRPPSGAFSELIQVAQEHLQKPSDDELFRVTFSDKQLIIDAFPALRLPRSGEQGSRKKIIDSFRPIEWEYLPYTGGRPPVFFLKVSGKMVDLQSTQWTIDFVDDRSQSRFHLRFVWSSPTRMQS